METGYLEVICGPMFCGKTERLISRVNHWRRDGYQFIAIKPSVDDRYDNTKIVSHQGTAVDAQLVSPNEPWSIPPEFTHIAVDEAQFLSTWEAEYLISLANLGKCIVITGLDLDAAGRPFGPMPMLLAFADSITKLRGICASCQSASTRSQLLTGSFSAVRIGGAEAYEPRCSRCFIPVSSNVS